MNDDSVRVIVCPAIRARDTGVVLCGLHHGTCMGQAINLGLKKEGQRWDIGFIDNKGVFVDRKEAWKIADAAGQIRRPTGWEKDYSQARPAGVGDDGLLFSENLYYW